MLEDLCNSIFPPRLLLIRSLHIHFHFRQLDADGVTCQLKREEFPSPWDEWTFETLTEIICQRLPNLKSLSVFLQGPLITLSAYRDATRCLEKVSRQLKSLDFMAVRFPRPASDAMFQRRGHSEVEKINSRLRGAQESFRIIQPDVEPGCTEHDVADLDTGVNNEWKVGTLYTGVDRVSGELESRHYAVFPQGRRGRGSGQ